MNPQFIEKPAVTLVGIVGTGSSVGDLNMTKLWQRFARHKSNIPKRLDKKFYEMHIEEDAVPPMHFCLCGVAVAQLESASTELFCKVIPAGRYAYLRHQLKDGTANEAFEAVYGYIRKSDYTFAYAFDLQCFDENYIETAAPQGTLEIFVPVKKRKGTRPLFLGG